MVREAEIQSSELSTKISSLLITGIPRVELWFYRLSNTIFYKGSQSAMVFLENRGKDITKWSALDK